MGTFLENLDLRITQPSHSSISPVSAIQHPYFAFQIYKKKEERNLELICN